MEQLATRTQVNEYGQPELWLHDGSRKLTPAEIAWLRGVTEASQEEHEWQQRLANATSLDGLVRCAWNEVEQRFMLFRYLGDSGNRRYLSDAEFEAMRQYILAKRPAAESGFVVGGSAQ